MTTAPPEQSTQTQIKPELSNLVEGLIQIDASDTARLFYDEFEGKGFYSTNKSGDLIALIIRSNTKNIQPLEHCTKLKELYLESPDLEEIPDYIFKLKSLTRLHITGSRISNIPQEIKNLANLKYLNFESNSIKCIPESFSELLNIEVLTLSNNSLSEFPTSILKSKNSRILRLDLDHNKIKNIPEEIEKLSHLKFLTLSQNQIKELPASLSNLKELIALSLDHNEISEVGNSLKGIPSLFHLTLSNNNLKNLKGKLPDVRAILELHGNDLTIPDPSFHELTPSEKIEVLNNFDEFTLKPLKQAKILVVGDERVGKTSIINRLLGNPHNENQTSTQGIDISELTFNDYTANIWDFAGQELTHQTHQFFLTERSLYIYVLDAQKEDNQARDLHWLNTIKSYSADSPIIVVANHSDQNSNYQFDLQRYQGDFNIVQVISTSACNLNTLPEEVKNKIGNSIERLTSEISNQLPKLNGINRLLPESWHKVKESIELYKKTENIIAKDIYDSECQRQGIGAKPLQTALLKILNSIGTVVAYPNDFRLKLTQILKPEWVTNAVYKIVRSPSSTPGVYSEDLISSILDDDYTLIQQQWLIDLLIKFELGFRLQHNNDLLIPMRLPSVTPEYNRNSYSKGLNIRFNYHRKGLLKSNTLPQLIVRMHNYVDEKTSKYWRSGIFVSHKDCKGIITADEHNQSIEVNLTTRDENARNLLQWIRSNIEAIEKAQINANRDKAKPYNEEIALFDETYSQVVGYVNYDRIERAFIKEKDSISLEVINPESGEFEDIDYNVPTLLGQYKRTNDSKLGPHYILVFLTRTLLRFTEFRAKIINEMEDDINDRLKESLNSNGILVSDQSRGGFSGSGKGSGERDLVILNEYGQQEAIIEAMVLTNANKKTISKHYDKLINNYNTHGNPADYLITYAKVKNLNHLWRQYKKHLDLDRDMTSDFADKTNIKIGKSVIKIDDTEQTRHIFHIMVNFGVPPES
ncbi:COR domain-containing protein [Thalassolituus sp. C2-1]|uniref:COR domain-containing protein n=1 Tax=Venatorbacter sp. C2-1 TaxID=2597518 RepID=UPI0016455C98|nr:COR domain-containing protein [Thalassolituus sp. C2-1]